MSSRLVPTRYPERRKGMIEAISHRFGAVISARPRKLRAALGGVAAVALIANCTAEVKTGTVMVPPAQARSHWSFQPLKRITPPVVKNTKWARTVIDTFMLARLEELGLQPAPPAGKRTLIRRATFDLIGLPPTPAEVN